jgi:hypothetical protein
MSPLKMILVAEKYEINYHAKAVLTHTHLSTSMYGLFRFYLQRNVYDEV